MGPTEASLACGSSGGCLDFPASPTLLHQPLKPQLAPWDGGGQKAHLIATELGPENQPPYPSCLLSTSLSAHLSIPSAQRPHKVSPSLHCDKHSGCLEVKTEPLEGKGTVPGLGLSSLLPVARGLDLMGTPLLGMHLKYPAWSSGAQ